MSSLKVQKFIKCLINGCLDLCFGTDQLICDLKSQYSIFLGLTDSASNIFKVQIISFRATKLITKCKVQM